jgi:hypothetical protein
VGVRRSRPCPGSLRWGHDRCNSWDDVSEADLLTVLSLQTRSAVTLRNATLERNIVVQTIPLLRVALTSVVSWWVIDDPDLRPPTQSARRPDKQLLLGRRAHAGWPVGSCLRNAPSAQTTGIITLPDGSKTPVAHAARNPAMWRRRKSCRHQGGHGLPDHRLGCVAEELGSAR